MDPKHLGGLEEEEEEEEEEEVVLREENRVERKGEGRGGEGKEGKGRERRVTRPLLHQCIVSFYLL